ncbi:cytochrome P450 family protein [Rhizoctonia solani]|uniref:Cytochrome P450 family protein n=1 Tax=Rhizoctonia solani TaxID=456999 RepID=A0A8H8SZC3_9AGAM|nr:cytochrome P450 family protein [Rhizoctonia solani]QRW24176.1 cytochrome P450 family protein [Rhizoctonia solani]
MLVDATQHFNVHYCTAAGALLVTFEIHSSRLIEVFNTHMQIAYYATPYLLDPHDYRRRFSGPWVASFTNRWLSKDFSSGHHCDTLVRLHEKYGKFARIGPNHISIADPEALEAVYGHSNGLLKSEFYETFNPGSERDVFNVRDRADHTLKRKRIANIFSPQSILAFEPRVKEHLQQFCAQLDMRCEQSLKNTSGFNWSAKGGRAVLNFPPQLAYLTFDIISDWLLGVFWKHPGISPIHTNAKLLLFGTPFNIPALITLRDFRNTTKAAVDARINRMKNDGQEDEERGADLMDRLFEIKNPDGSPLSREDIDAQAFLVFSAGSDTTANSLSGLSYYIASNPRARKKLQEELDSALSSSVEFDDDQVAHTVPSYEQIKNLPYLNACVKEGLRLYSTLGLGLPRVVPPGKTLTIAGETFNAGSVISVPSYLTNRSSVWGSDPEAYRPERWIEDTTGSLNKYFAAFSFGPRACLGRNLANLNLLLIAATFFHRYDVELASPSTKLSIKEGIVRESTRCELSLKRRV